MELRMLYTVLLVQSVHINKGLIIQILVMQSYSLYA